MDSTALSVCESWNIKTHKVTAGLASLGKTGKGWFLGFKLQGACDAQGNLVNLCLSPGGDHDGNHAEALTEGLSGLFVGDAGYLLRGEALQRLRKKHRHVLAAARRNMKRLMTAEQKRLMRKWGVLKGRFGLVFHLARTVTGLFRHYTYSLLSRMLKPVLFSLRLPEAPLALAA
ncbi:MAG: transposase [Treponema sp.]|nr:transposase [Treponema sp.]